MKYKRIRGTQDVLPPQVYSWKRVEKVFEETLESFGYQCIRTPIFETTELFVRSVGEHTDIISKEMYTFTDRGGRSVTLRPENTASVVRAYLESGMHRSGGMTRLYYIGPMFRYERPQAGRYRQFHQVGAEALGSMDPAVDVEIMALVIRALEALGFRGLEAIINSVGCRQCRGDYRKMLIGALETAAGRLCDDCRERMRSNPLRVFDCKKCAEIKRELPPISEHLCSSCTDHYGRVKALLRRMGTPFSEDPGLVRGLDYYTRTTFEVIHRELGAQNALCGGGRYDDLVEQCGGPPTPAVGFSAGLERIVSVLPEEGPGYSKPLPEVLFYVACADERSTGRSLAVAGKLRVIGPAEVDLSGRSLKKQLRTAERKGCRFSVVVSESGPLRLKVMATREEIELEEAELIERTKALVEEGESQA